MSIFDGANEQQVDEALALMRTHTAVRGEVLLATGVEEAVSIISVQCKIRFRYDDGVVIAEAPQGAVAGVAQVVWPGRPMSHTVEAAEDGDILLVPQESLTALRALGNPIAEGWEIYALQQTNESYRELRIAISELTPHATRATARSPRIASLLEEFLQATHYADRFANAVDIDQALTQSCLFEDADPLSLTALRPFLHQTVCEPGVILGQQFHVADGMYFVVDGEVELATSVTPDHAPRVIATAHAGALLGFAGVIGTVRLVTLVTSKRTTLLTMRATDLVSLLAEHSPRGTALRIALLRASADAIDSAEFVVHRLLVARTKVLRDDATEFIKEGKLVAHTNHGYRVTGV